MDRCGKQISSTTLPPSAAAPITLEHYTFSCKRSLLAWGWEDQAAKSTSLYLSMDKIRILVGQTNTQNNIKKKSTVGNKTNFDKKQDILPRVPCKDEYEQRVLKKQIGQLFRRH